MQCVDVINHHAEVLEGIGKELGHQEQLLDELVKQHQQLIKNQTRLTNNLRLVHQRLATLEGRNDTE